MGKPALLYDNRLADATPVASDTASGYSVLNLVDWRPYTWWQPNSMPATVRVACGAAAAADYCLVWGHDLGTQGATLEVRGSTDGFVASDDLIETVSPANDSPFLLTFASANYTDWGIALSGAARPSLAVVAIGAMLRMPKYFPGPWDPKKRKPIGQVQRSVSGQPLGRTIDYEEFSETIAQKNITWSWVRDSWEPAWKTHLRASPFGLAWDPENYPGEIYLLNSKDGFETPHRHGQYADLSCDVVGAWPV